MFSAIITEAIEDIRMILDDPRDITTRIPEASDELKRQEVTRLLEVCASEREDLKKLLEQISTTRVEWAENVQKMSKALKSEAESEYSDFEEHLDKDTLKQAKIRVRLIEKTTFALKLEFDQLECCLSKKQTPELQTNSKSTSIQLPKIKLEKFNGTRARYREFRENFNAAVDTTNISKIQKMTYLRTLLTGEAKSVIDGLALTEENYQIAMDLLDRRYDNREETIRQLYNEINTLKICKSFEDCREFADKLECLCRQLETMGESLESRQTYLSLEQKLHKPMLREILKEKEKSINWNTSTFRIVLRDLILKEETFQRIANVQMSESKSTRQNVNQEHVRNSHVAFSAPPKTSFPTCPNTAFKRTSQPSNVSAKLKCQFCEQNHWSTDCERFANATDRYERAKSLKLCCKCLSKAHHTSDCDKARVCFYCKKSHHSALCRQQFGQSTETHISTAATVHSLDRVLLMSATAILKNPDNKKLQQKVVIFFDTGSHGSFMTKSVSEKLKLRSKNECSMSVYTFGAAHSTEHKTHTVTANLKLRGKNDLPIQLNVVDTIIPTSVPMALINAQQRGKIDQEAVEKAIINCKPDVLIGMDLIHQFKITAKQQINNGYVVSDSIVGPIVSGTTANHKSKNNKVTLLSVSVVNNTTNKMDELYQIVQNQFNLDKIGIEEDLCDEEENVLENFNKSLKVVDGRYEVSLPWKEPMPNLESNYWLARGRLRSTMKTLKQRPQLLEQYHQIMIDQLKKEIIEKVDTKLNKEQSIVHFLPHQAVIRDDKMHTKLRVVYDGSAKTNKNSNSINQCLHRGPILMNDLVGIMLRVRIPKICIVADIEKAFLQLSIRPEDRDACRFLWPENPFDEKWEQNLNIYRFRRVTFGLICSPFLLSATIKEHLRRDGSDFAKNMLENVYVDNIFMRAASKEETLEACKRAKEIFAKVSMNLREFASNDRETISKLNKEDQMPNEQIKILGILWDTKSDNFRVKMRFVPEEFETKRTVLHKIAAAYDPMGWIAPAMLAAKKFFQQLWKVKLSWDESIPHEMMKQWRLIGNSWNHEIQIPRLLFHTADSTFTLHIFSDASKDAVGACAYLCSNEKMTQASKLIFSKCRIINLKSKITIPKLELHALKLAARMAEFISKHLSINRVQLWTDSQCVIHWLNSTANLERYVENRAKIIRQFNVRYVKTEDNPADLITRGSTFKELEKNDNWWFGPAWLSSEKLVTDELLQYDKREYDNRVITNSTIHSCCAPAIKEVEVDKSIIDLSRFSTWNRAARVTAYVLKVVDRLLKRKDKKHTNDAYLNAKDISKAKFFLIKEAQNRNKPSEDTIKALEMFKNQEGLWTCKGRIGNSAVNEETKLPIWLPKGDRLTMLIVLDAHNITFHAGSNTTLAFIRTQFWIPQGRRTIKTIINKECMNCRKFLAKPYKLPKVPNLPPERVTHSRPFEHTGLDYFGPLSTRRSKEKEPGKIWVGIFTCFVTRAVHLEVVSDLSADAFLLAFRRFIARRGTPSTIMSDNGTNFKLASKVIHEAWKNVITSTKIQAETANRGIKWTFIAERAPWRGGLWERLIGIIKSALKKTVGRKIIETEELITMMTEIEMIVNNRPLTYISDDEYTKPLRPIDFLIPYDIVEQTPDIEEIDEGDPTYRPEITTRDKVVDRFESTIKRVNQFWNQWHREYLLSLRERQNTLNFRQGITSSTCPTVGEVVLLQENDVPRNYWRLARIEELLPGSDGQIRTARIKCGNRKLIRATNVLYPLEIQQTEMENTVENKISKITCIIIQNHTHATISNITKVNQEIFESNHMGDIKKKKSDLVIHKNCSMSFEYEQEQIVLGLESDEDEVRLNRSGLSIPSRRETRAQSSRRALVEKSNGNEWKREKADKHTPKPQNSGKTVKRMIGKNDWTTADKHTVKGNENFVESKLNSNYKADRHTYKRRYQILNSGNLSKRSRSNQLEQNMFLNNSKISGRKSSSQDTADKQTSEPRVVIKRTAKKLDQEHADKHTLKVQNIEPSFVITMQNVPAEVPQALSITIPGVQSIDNEPWWCIKSNTNTGWEITRNCADHENCVGVSISDLVKSACSKNIANIIGEEAFEKVPTLLHLFFLRWAIRKMNHTSSTATIARYVAEIMCTDTKNIVNTHDEVCQSVISTVTKPNATNTDKWFDKRDVKASFELWRKACQTAKDTFDHNPWKAVKMEEFIIPAKSPDSKKFFTGISNRIGSWLTLYRQAVFFPSATPTFAKCIIIGDELIQGGNPQVKEVRFFHTEMKKTKEKIASLYFTERTNTVVICTGLSVVRKLHTIDSYHNCLKEIDQYARQYTGINWLVVSPPQLRGEDERYKRLTKTIMKPWNRLQIVSGVGGKNVWLRAFDSVREYPTSEDYANVLSALVRRGVDLNLPEPESEDREPLELRLKRLLDLVQAYAAGDGSVANAKEV